MKERYQHWLDQATEDSDILVFIESECARREALAREEERKKIATEVRTIADRWEMNDARTVRGMEKEILALLTPLDNQSQ